ncbi:MAG: deoxyribodipyrimidine photo-lyase [Alphaproteobacteria bacterium]|nr:deoxyribodipyrimidine photo-lyase [Alphaproteobacteria bacterium]MBU1513073.1 deoxyribodipyrimidine photo-lyase [Alphaproteobacteria bacterium]MBU2095181.1 deoxyribodipyrimidine photo-lyase [Alphaproteobacteria bacterium]MBU2150660.1 deoxyribodipyrimidine photo-lyase [Alphaproteobacteria bacterium]MBU2306081.1 deoxyribodipyrimidine photo-lyase [Alphaproteobacteria bacterium]
MQQSQRAEFNPALEYALEQANALNLPVLVCFGLAAFPEANARHYDFMLRGLAEVRRRLTARGVGFVIRKSPPHDLARQLAADAALVVCDRGYLKIQRTWRAKLVEGLDRRLVQIEGDVVVPVEAVTQKHEYAARTIRPRIHRIWDDHLDQLESRAVRRRADHLTITSDVDLDDVPKVLAGLKIDATVGPVRRFVAGEGAARARLEAFIADALPRYGAERGKPEAGVASHMSPYLHFGQISPVEIALAVRRAPASDSRASYLEELIVRRELAMNHAFYEPGYDTYDILPEWARKTLADHAGDPRPHLYGRAQFEAAETHDPYWNAAMREMLATGYMHNHLRMYWGKKILQWSAGPEEAFETTLALNNRWFLDGRDPNSFTNVGWLFGLHDRPWGPQPVFGTVRSMGANTFKKFDADAYVRQVATLEAAEQG